MGGSLALRLLSLFWWWSEINELNVKYGIIIRVHDAVTSDFTVTVSVHFQFLHLIPILFITHLYSQTGLPFGLLLFPALLLKVVLFLAVGTYPPKILGIVWVCVLFCSISTSSCFVYYAVYFDSACAHHFLLLILCQIPYFLGFCVEWPFAISIFLFTCLHLLTCILIAVSSLIISEVITLSLIPFMNCSFTLLSCSWYLHSVAYPFLICFLYISD